MDFSIGELESTRKFVSQGRSPKTLHTSRASNPEISFADTVSLVAWETVDGNCPGNQNKSRKHSLSKARSLPCGGHEYSQKPGRFIKTIGKQGTILHFRTVFRCEHCRFSTSKPQVFNDHSHNSSHLDIFAKKNL